MFKVLNYGSFYTVYSVRVTDAGETEFLIFDSYKLRGNQWMWVNANEYVPA